MTTTKQPAIGFNGYMSLLRKYKSKKGNIAVPYSYTTTGGIKLGRWLSTKKGTYRIQQRNAKMSYLNRRPQQHALSVGETNELEDLGIDWGYNEEKENEKIAAKQRAKIAEEKEEASQTTVTPVLYNDFFKKYRLLSKFKTENGHCIVAAKDHELHSWCEEMRRLSKEGLLDFGKKSMLGGIGFHFSDFDECFEELMTYRATHPRNCPVPDTHPCYQWYKDVITLRCQGNLTEGQEYMLKASSNFFDWNVVHNPTNITTPLPLQTLDQNQEQGRERNSKRPSSTREYEYTDSDSDSDSDNGNDDDESKKKGKASAKNKSPPTKSKAKSKKPGSQQQNKDTEDIGHYGGLINSSNGDGKAVVTACTTTPERRIETKEGDNQSGDGEEEDDQSERSSSMKIMEKRMHTSAFLDNSSGNDSAMDGDFDDVDDVDDVDEFGLLCIKELALLTQAPPGDTRSKACASLDNTDSILNMCGKPSASETLSSSKKDQRAETPALPKFADINSLNVPALREFCKSLNLSKVGVKFDLQTRLTEHFKSQSRSEMFLMTR
jgi:hypothetical protein